MSAVFKTSLLRTDKLCSIVLMAPPRHICVPSSFRKLIQSYSRAHERQGPPYQNPSPASRGLACIGRSLRINPYLLISLLNIRPSGLVSGTKLPDLCSSSSTTHLSLSSDIVSLFQQAQFPFSWSQLCQFNLESNPPAFAIDSDFLFIPNCPLSSGSPRNHRGAVLPCLEISTKQSNVPWSLNNRASETDVCYL